MKCRECDQPILRKGQKRKHQDDYRHASGCPLDDEAAVKAATCRRRPGKRP